MIVTEDLTTLSYTVRDGFKCFELIAEEVTQQLLPGIYQFQVTAADGNSIPACNRLLKKYWSHWVKHGILSSLSITPVAGRFIAIFLITARITSIRQQAVCLLPLTMIDM